MNFRPSLRQVPQIPSWSKTKEALKSKRGRYLIGIALDLTCLSLIIINGAQPAARLISPFIEPLYQNQKTAEVRSTKESFSFAPGSATNKFPKIRFQNLNTLAYFDLPISSDGSFNKNSKGYINFKSDAANTLFNRAHLSGTKVLATLTMTNTSHIRALLDDQTIQQRLIEEAVTEVKEAGIDGVAVDLEPAGVISSDYANKLNKFMANLTLKMHQEISLSKVAIVLPSKANGSGNLFDPEGLAQSTDQIFVMAANFAVPEVQNALPINPVYGYNERSYWSDVSEALNSFENTVPTEKLVLERAWYGDGEHYPLYIPDNQPQTRPHESPATEVVMNEETLDKLVKSVPSSARAAARKNIPIIAKALKDEAILNSNVLAYALATIEHETAGTFEPIEEIQGRFSARRLGYEGGMNYFGRGFIQLTHLRNYKTIGERIGLGDSLAAKPEIASKPEISAKILAAFFKDNNIAHLATVGNFYAARMPVNPDRNAGRVAQLAWKYDY